MRDIYHTRLTAGLALAWVNSYSAVVIRTPGATLLFDPVGMAVPEGASVDLIGISHEHSDHWQPELVVNLQQRTGAMVATTPFLASRLASLLGQEESKRRSAKGGCGRPAADSSELAELEAPRHAGMPLHPMRPGDTLQIGDVRLLALRCDHAARQSLAFLVRTADRLSVYLPGDGTPFPEMAQLAEIHQPDILLWMGTALDDGARIARLMHPNALVTYAISPPAAGERARRILISLAPQVQFYALRRHQVFVYPCAPRGK